MSDKTVHCAFLCDNATGDDLYPVGYSYNRKYVPTIKVSPIPPVTNGEFVEFATCSGRPDSTGSMLLFRGSSEGTFVCSFDWDNPSIGPASTSKKVTATGYKMKVELTNDVWSVTCTKDSKDE